jgi:hypothetical protein
MHSFTVPLANLGAGAGVSLKTRNRYYQVLYMVTLLILAVALTTVLVVAAEHSSTDRSKRTTSELQGLQVPTAGRPGPLGCV